MNKILSVADKLEAHARRAAQSGDPLAFLLGLSPPFALLETSARQVREDIDREFSAEREGVRLISPRETAERLASTRRAFQRLAPRGLRTARRGLVAYTGSLSPGCRACNAGKWVCLFPTAMCTGGCFFCPPGNRSGADALFGGHPPPIFSAMKTDVSISLGPTATTLDQLFQYIEIFGARGVSFSGGDPLLCLDRVLSFCRVLRRRYGRRLYLWLYTNGNLLSDGIVKLLRKEGIDEIRLNLAARGYDPAPLEAVRKHYRVTTVEIPAIPAHESRLFRLVDTLEEMGLTHLNIHEFCPPLAAGRTHPGGAVTVAEGMGKPWYLRTSYTTQQGSEELCLRLLERALERKTAMSVHYCSNRYRATWQKAFILKRLADYFAEPHQRIVPPGMLESLAVPLSTQGRLEGAVPEKDMARNTPFGVIEVHPRHLDAVKALGLPVARTLREPVFHRTVDVALQ